MSMPAVQPNWRSFAHASEEMRANVNVRTLTEAIETALKDAPKEVKNNEAIVMAAVKQDWKAIQYAGEEMKNNEAVVMAALKQSWQALQYASEAMKNNEAIVMAAMKQDSGALEHASEELKNHGGSAAGWACTFRRWREGEGTVLEMDS